MRRSLEITLTNSNDSPARTPVRIGYAWRVEPPDEIHDLDAQRVLLQHWNPELRAWQTNGLPRRATARSAWNKLSDEDFLAIWVMDSVRFVPIPHGSFALGVDSTRTTVPTAFFRCKHFEGVSW